MSEQTPEAVATATEPAAESTAQQQPATGAETPELGDAGKAAIERMKAERDAARRQAAANAEAAKRLQEIEDAQKTEQQRLAERQAQIERERDEARAEGLRYKAAATHGISEDHFDLLGAGDEETITQRAERLGALLKAASEVEQLRAEVEALRAGRPAPTTARPIEQLKPGATPEHAQTQDDADYAALFGAGG